jgi:hypothetical protein
MDQVFMQDDGAAVESDGVAGGRETVPQVAA